MILMLLVVAGVVGALAFVKFRQIQVAMAQGASFQPPPEAVTTTVAEKVDWPSTLNAIGTVAAIQGVTVSADLPGIVERIEFESGQYVKQGQVLVVLNTRQEQAQLAALEAARDLAKLNYERMKNLVSGGAVSQTEYDVAEAEQKASDAKVGEIRATIDRKTIRAPFSGVLGLRQVNLGQYLDGGAPVVPLQSLDPIYVNFAVPQQDASRMQRGREVQIRATDANPIAITGRVTAIDSVVDPGTRNVQVQATLRNPNGRLRPGMFVETAVVLGASLSVIALPAPAINYAPYGDSVFIVKDLKGQNGQTYKGVEQQFVKLGGSRGDQVAILSGIEPGQEIVTSGVFKLRNGAAVVVNNKVKPENNPAPKPEDS
jgi:membrane fusion protein (multidrug efflux system)